MHSVNENMINIKAKILEQAHSLIKYVEDSYETGVAAHQVEDDLFKQLMQMGYQGITLLFQHYGRCDLGEKMELSDGSWVNRLPEPHKKEYLSIFGLLEHERYVYGSREGQKIDYVPFDARLQLPKLKFSYLLQDWDQSLATEIPFQKVNDTLGRILNLSVPVSSLERTNQNMNQYSERYWDNQVEIKSAENEQLVIGSSDCKGVVIRKSVEEKAAYLLKNEAQCKPASIESSASKKKGGKKKMAVLGAVYTVEPNYRTPSDVLESLFRPAGEPSPYGDYTSRPKPQGKHVRASMHRDDADTLQPAREEIFSWLEQEYNERNPKGKNKNILLMDGEEKLWKMGGELKTRSSLIEILDIIHASSYLWKAVQALHPKNTIAENIPLVKKQVGRLLEGDAQKVIRSLRWQATHMKLKDTDLENLNKSCNYLAKNIKRMDYKQYLEAGYPIASGVIEGACRNVVVDRMECSGMRWVMDGAKSMLNIRCIHLNGDWDRFVNFYIKNEQKNIFPIGAANDELFIESMIA